MLRTVRRNICGGQFFCCWEAALVAALVIASAQDMPACAQQADPTPAQHSTHSHATSKQVRARGEGVARQLLQMMDADKNGVVSKEEFLQFMSQTFDRLDTNKNNQLEKEELRRLNDRDWIVCHDLHVC